ncbi:hypothetical protein HDU91_001379, partial [Kappamyces sp. JEL0680]
LEETIKMEGVHYLAPPVQRYGLMQFANFAEIEQVGYDYMKKIITKWNDDGTLWEQFGVRLDSSPSGPTGRRASI